MKEYIFKAQSKEWLNIRSKYLTGTEVASLFALNPYKSAQQVYREKVAGKSEPLEDNDHLIAGRRFEPAAVIALNEYGITAEPAAPWNHTKVIVNGQLSASLDAVTTDGVYVEIKTTEKKFNEYKNGYIPNYYLLQCQAQLAISESKEMFLVAAEQSRLVPIVVFKILGNKKLQKIIIDATKRFWDNIRNKEKYKINQEEKSKVLELLGQTVRFYDK